MRELWGEDLKNDPFYNPNLALSTISFTLAFPPRIAKVPPEAGLKVRRDGRAVAQAERA